MTDSTDPKSFLVGSGLSEPEVLRRWITSPFAAQCIYVAAKLGIADLLAAGPTPVAGLARRAGVDERALYRVLRLLAAIGVFEELPERQFTLNERGRHLCKDAPQSVRDAAILFGEEPYRAVGDLLATVETGSTAFDRIFGCGHFDYLARSPEAGATFHRAMNQLTAIVGDDILEALELEAEGTVVDVGGGEGHLLARILKAREGLRGILFELEEAAVRARELIAEEGLEERCRVVSGDLLEEVPAGGDVYLLKSVLHAWNDERSMEMLRSCRRAMGAAARLAVVERVVEDGESWYPKLNDIVMLAVTGGRERTAAEYAALFEGAGLVLVSIDPTPSGFCLIQGRRP